MAEILRFTGPANRPRPECLCARFWRMFRERFGAIDLPIEAELLDTYTRMMRGRSAGLREVARQQGRLAEAICKVGRTLFFDGDSADAPVDRVALETYEAVRDQILARKAEAQRVMAAPNVVIFPRSVRYWRV